MLLFLEKEQQHCQNNRQLCISFDLLKCQKVAFFVNNVAGAD